MAVHSLSKEEACRIAIHEDVPFNESIAVGVRTEIHDLAIWLGLEVVGL